MRLSELLVHEWVALPLESGDLEGVLGELLGRVSAAGGVKEAGAGKLAHELARGSKGEVVRLNDSILAVLAPVEGLGDLAISLGVAGRPFEVAEVGGGGTGRARAVILALVPGRLSAVRQELIQALGRVFRDQARTDQLLRARTLDEVRGFRDLMEVELRPRLLVRHALVPLQYRVYPDTALEEVVDLMVRRGMHAVPVVGQGYEVLGILTTGDALEYVIGLRGGRGGREPTGGRPATAKDFMTRSVLCVSEEQSLVEAANMMVNRDVEQLPVVRDGELVGFVTRDSILRALNGDPIPDKTNPREPEKESPL